MVVDVAEYRTALHGERPEHTRPELELVRPVDLYARVVHDRAIGTHPSYVNEIRRRLRCKLHHLLTRDPPRVRQRQRDAVLGEKGEHAFVDPASLPELDGESQIGWQRRQKLRERGQLRRAEIGAEL